MCAVAVIKSAPLLVDAASLAKRCTHCWSAAICGFRTFTVPPGSHVFTVKMWDTPGTCELTADIQPDVEYFYEVTPRVTSYAASMPAALVGTSPAGVLFGAGLSSAGHSVESAGNFDVWIGTLSLGSLLPLMRASIASARGDFERALALYGEDFHSTAEQGQLRVLPALFADRAWCRCQSGDLAGARADVAQAEDRVDSSIDNDDLALAHGRLAQVLAVLGESASAQGHERRAHDALAHHRRDQSRVLEAFASVLEARSSAASVRTTPC